MTSACVGNLQLPMKENETKKNELCCTMAKSITCAYYKHIFRNTKHRFVGDVCKDDVGPFFIDSWTTVSVVAIRRAFSPRRKEWSLPYPAVTVNNGEEKQKHIRLLWRSWWYPSFHRSFSTELMRRAANNSPICSNRFTKNFLAKIVNSCKILAPSIP